MYKYFIPHMSTHAHNVLYTYTSRTQSNESVSIWGHTHTDIHKHTFEFAFNLNWFEWIRWWQKNRMCMCVCCAPWKFLLSHWKLTHYGVWFRVCFSSIPFTLYTTQWTKKLNEKKMKNTHTYRTKIFDRCVTRSIGCKVCSIPDDTYCIRVNTHTHRENKIKKRPKMGTELLFIATAAAIGVTLLFLFSSISGENLTLIFGYLNIVTTHMRSKWIDLFNELNCAKIKRVCLWMWGTEQEYTRSQIGYFVANKQVSHFG